MVPAITLDYTALFAPTMTEVSNGISDILPYGVAVFGALLAIKLGTKVFKRLAN